MYLNFTNINSSVSGVSILIDNADLNYSSNLEKVFSVGYKGCVGYNLNKRESSNLNLTYYNEINKDPIFSGIQEILKNPILNSYNGLPIVICNLSGVYYPESFSIDFNGTDSFIKSSTSFVSFDGLSGEIKSSNINNNYNSSNNEHIAHIWNSSLLFNNEHGFDKAEITNFSYTCDFTWNPIYKIGSKIPNQIELNNITETLTINLNNVVLPNYTGIFVSDYFNSKDIKIEIKPLRSITDNLFLDSMYIRNLESGYVKDIDISFDKNNYQVVNMTIYKQK